MGKPDLKSQRNGFPFYDGESKYWLSGETAQSISLF